MSSDQRDSDKPNSEMLKHLDLLMNWDYVKNESAWSALENIETINRDDFEDANEEDESDSDED